MMHGSLIKNTVKDVQPLYIEITYLSSAFHNLNGNDFKKQ